MKKLKLLFLILCTALSLTGSYVLAQKPKTPDVYFYNKTKAIEQTVRLNKKCLVSFKKAPEMQGIYPPSISDTAFLYNLSLTGQLGQTLVFNDSIFIPFHEINYIEVKQKHYALKLISTCFFLIPICIFNPWTLAYTTSTIAFASAVPLTLLLGDQILIISPTTFMLQTQNNPEQLFKNKPQHQGKWPELKNRY